MWGLTRAGWPLLAVGKFVDTFSFPLLLAVFWHVTKKLYGARAAFFAIFIYSSMYPAYLASATLPAFNAAFVLGLLGCLAFHQKRPALAVMAFGLGFYTHTMAATVFLLGFFLHGLFSVPNRRNVVYTATASLLVALPFLIYQGMHRDQFIFLNLKENYFLEIDLSVYVMAVAGAWLAFKKKGVYGIPLCLVLSALPLARIYPVRFLCGQGTLFLALLAAFSTEQLFAKILRDSGRVRNVVFFLAVFLVYFGLVAPVMKVDLQDSHFKVLWRDRTLTRFLLPPGTLDFNARSFTIYFPDDYDEIVKVIKSHSASDDILWSNFGHGGGILGVLSGRATSSSMLAEIKPKKTQNPLFDAKILVWFKDKTGGPPGGMRETVARMGLGLLSETKLVYIYENPSARSKRVVVKAAIPWITIEIALAILFLIAILEEILLRRLVPKNPH
jgi:hypothetical protein